MLHTLRRLAVWPAVDLHTHSVVAVVFLIDAAHTRGSDGRRYPWGEAWAEGCCNVGGNDTTPVDAYPAGASPYGCLDLLGNVQEWTCTLWGSQPDAPAFGYPYDPHDGREVNVLGDLPPQTRLVQRGGSFKAVPDQVRCAARGHADPASKIAWRGFRVAMAL